MVMMAPVSGGRGEMGQGVTIRLRELVMRTAHAGAVRRLGIGLTAAAVAVAAMPARAREPEPHHRTHYIIRRGRRFAVPPSRSRVFRGVVVLRPYGNWYAGYGLYRTDRDAYKWLGFAAITMPLLNALTEPQQRALEEAQIRATTAPIGERIVWTNGTANGSVTAVREGTSTSGRYCREFQQQVIAAGRMQEVYGTACRRPDGSWEVISTGNGP